MNHTTAVCTLEVQHVKIKYHYYEPRIQNCESKLRTFVYLEVQALFGKMNVVQLNSIF